MTCLLVTKICNGYERWISGAHNGHGVLYIRSDKVGRVIKKGSNEFKCFRPLIILINQRKHIV